MDKTLSLKPFFSLIIPTFNEGENLFFRENLREHYKNDQIEIIIVDGGSADQTQFLSEAANVIWVSEQFTTRAHRLNAGSVLAQGHWIIWVHPRSRITNECLNQLKKLKPSAHAWGAWTHSFDDNSILYKLTSFYSNWIRGDLRSIFYLDHCLFVHRDLFLNKKTSFFPDVAIFEDTLVCYSLRQICRGFRIKKKVITSSIRFKKNGFVKQVIINMFSKLNFFINKPNEQINTYYESDLLLNGPSIKKKNQI